MQRYGNNVELRVPSDPIVQLFVKHHTTQALVIAILHAVDHDCQLDGSDALAAICGRVELAITAAGIGTHIRHEKSVVENFTYRLHTSTPPWQRLSPSLRVRLT